MDDKTITIPLEEYRLLRLRSYKLQALEDYGVDNWIGYEEAMQYMEEELIAGGDSDE